MGSRSKRNVPAKRPAASSRQEVRVTQEYFQGPFPHPDMLQKYKEVDSGFTDRIFNYAEKEQDHRHKTQEEKISLEKREMNFGFFMQLAASFCVTAMFLGFLVAGSYALYLGHTKTSIFIYTVPIVKMFMTILDSGNKKSDKKN